MSSEPTITSAAPAYDDAERGTLEVVRPAPVSPVSYPSDKKEDPFKDEKKAIATVTAVEPLPSSKEKAADAAPAPRALAAKKPKKKVSKWIIWQLWFNTYRFVVFTRLSLRYILITCYLGNFSLLFSRLI